jgi:PAS domain S-box-containing protein
MSLQALRTESEQLFRYLFEQASLGIAVEDLAGNILLANPALCSMLGYGPRELDGMSCCQFASAEDSQDDWALFQQLREGTIDHYSLDKRYTRKDGAQMWGRLNVSLLKDAHAGSPLVFALVEDVTERRRVEEALKRSEANYRLFVSQSSEGIFCQELDHPIPIDLPEDEQVHRILYQSYMAECNQALARMYGLSPDDFVGKRLTETLDVENSANVDLTRIYIRGGYRVLERESHEVDAQGNSKIFLNSMIGIVENGRLLRTWGIQRDVTERHQAENARIRAEQALRNSEERLRLAAEAGRMYAYEWDVLTDKSVRSEEAVKVLGLGDEPTELTRHELSDRVHPDDRAEFLESVTRLTPENPTIHTSYRVLRPDGSTAWLEKHGRAFFDGQGKMQRMIGMVADITDRKHAEEVLRQREMELTEAQRLAQVGSWQWDPQTDTVIWSEQLYRITGRDSNLPAATYKEHAKLYTAESWVRLQHAVEETLRSGTPYELDLEIVHPNAKAKWIRARGEAQRDKSGKVILLRGTAQDITERKNAEAALATLGRKLIEAQEQERARIARDLHDNVNQRLALLAIQLERVKVELNHPSADVLKRMAELRKQTFEISTEVQALSHELHPPKLDHLGMIAVLRGFCREFAEQQKLEVDFRSQGLANIVPPDISLCLFRVLQEALHNAAKHSGVRSFEVRLRQLPNEIELTVRDAGVGFDPKASMLNWGLGLVSMQERLQLVKGSLSIDSKPKRGTTICARVPLHASGELAQAVG